MIGGVFWECLYRMGVYMCIVVVVEGGDKLNKIVVVVGPRGIDRQYFTGGDLEIINKGNLGAKSLSKLTVDIPNTLIIKDSGKVIAVFNQWQYWRKLPID